MEEGERHIEIPTAVREVPYREVNVLAAGHSGEIALVVEDREGAVSHRDHFGEACFMLGEKLLAIFEVGELTG